MSNINTQKKEKNRRKVLSWPHVFRDVLVASINKGQFPIAILSIIIMMIIWKMPAEDVSKFVFEIKNDFFVGGYFGYMLFLVSLVGWSVHLRMQRIVFTSEIDRISSEKTKIQEQALDSKVRSSNAARAK